MRRPPLAALWIFLWGTAVAAPIPLRQPNPGLNVPASPPPLDLDLVNAFPGLSFTEPVAMTSPPGDTKRLFVCEQGGKIWVIPDVTATPATKLLFLDLVTLVNSRSGRERLRLFSESGLLGMAFHPDYLDNRYFYLFYTPGKGKGSTPPMHERLARFTTRADDPNSADTTSELVLFDQRDENDNHNGGDLHFGPDGYLYFSLGDEGSQNDNRLNSQRIDKDFFSGIMRIDVDKKPGNLEPNAHPNPADYPFSQPPDAVIRDAGIARYSIPADNPFVGATAFNGQPVSPSHVRSEFFAVGLRNPWRFSFDPAAGHLWCGDVGGSSREEVNRIIAGGNYGWVYREGPSVGPWDDSSPVHPAPPSGFSSIDPLHSYTHADGNNAIVGGIVYRGSRIPPLQGKYLFGDNGSGNIWSMDPDGTGVTRILGEAGISAFGTDPSNQDILIADENGNRILRVVSTGTTLPGFPETLGATGLFTHVANLSVAPGTIPYSVNLPFWSDHAVKTRYFTIPNPAAKIIGSKDGLWTFPQGSIWVKHFDMDMDRGHPASRKKIETRLLVKTASGAYGVSYRWNAAGTEATLVADAGENFMLDVVQEGTPRPQLWRIPSRAECTACHTSQAGFALSFTTRQLNLEATIGGHSGNQLRILYDQGYLANDPGSPNLLPRHLRADEEAFSMEARVRSYLAVNCSYCHQQGGTALGQWDGRPELLLAQTGIVNGPATNNGGNEANKLVVPGDTTHSIILNRIAVTNGFTRMPPLGSNVIDAGNAALMAAWIDGELLQRKTYEEWRTLKFSAEGDPAGAPGADADGDGVSNRAEYLAGTEPLDGSSAMRTLLTPDSVGLKLRFPVPANRSYRIEATQDLRTWTPWDIPGNQGLPAAGGEIELRVPPSDSMRFFRVELREN